MIRLDELYDADATTVPSDTGPTPTCRAGDRRWRWPLLPALWALHAQPAAPCPPPMAPPGSAYLLDSALTAAPTFTTVGNSVNCASSFPGYSFAKGVEVGGNFFYFDAQLAFDVVKLNRLWTSTLAGPCVDASDVVTSFNNSGGGGMAVAGGQAFALGASELHALELSRPRQRHHRWALLHRGHRAAERRDVRQLRDDGRHQRAALARGGDSEGAAAGLERDGWRPAGRVGAWVSVLRRRPRPQPPLHAGLVRADGARGRRRRVVRPVRLDLGALRSISSSLLRAPASTFTTCKTRSTARRAPRSADNAADVTSVMHPTNTVRITGVEAVGNFLVAREVRTDGISLEVFNARALRSEPRHRVRRSHDLGGDVQGRLHHHHQRPLGRAHGARRARDHLAG